MTSGEPVMLLSVHRTRSRRMEFCVHGGLGDTLNKQRRKLNGYPGALLASYQFLMNFSPQNMTVIITFN